MKCNIREEYIISGKFYVVTEFLRDTITDELEMLKADLFQLGESSAKLLAQKIK